MKFCTYDTEILKNFMSMCFLDNETEARKEFVLYAKDTDKENLKKLVKFLYKLKKHDYYLIGFNCNNFDAQLIEHILENYEFWMDWDSMSMKDITESIYQKAQDIIALQGAEKFPNLIPEWRFNIPHIDVFKQKHYDGTAKMGTSLKWIQFSMRYHTVEEMPIHHTAEVSPEEIPQILSYNWNDVLSTYEFFKKIKFETDLRLALSEKYNLNLLNASEPRIAKMIFGKFLCADMNIQMKELRDMKTYRKSVKLKDVIFPYVKFNTPELNTVLDAVKQVVVEFGNDDKNKFKYTFKYAGIETDIGLGGIHACCAPGVYEATEDWLIDDVDVKSFYPNLSIQNDVKPKHLGNSFPVVYKNIYDERTKIPKKDPVNYVYKIILNSTYGLSKEINSYLYDPFFTYSITINGQLSLLMLVERLWQEIPGIVFYQENTDGVTFGYDKQYKDKVKNICHEWEIITKQELEYASYKKMIIRDVNNYIAIKHGFNWDEYQSLVKQGKRKDYEKIKHKGIFELELEYHKNPSFLIVPIAVEAYFVGNQNYRELIHTHDDIYDFLGAVKRKSNFDLNLYTSKDGETTKESQQKVTRYYISKDGGTLTKDFKDGRKVNKVAVEAGWKVSILNKVTDTNAHSYKNLNHLYYIKETEKLIASIEGNKQQGKLF